MASPIRGGSLLSLTVGALCGCALVSTPGGAGNRSTDRAVRTVIDPGNLKIDGGRLYFGAWAMTDDRVVATLTGPGVAAQSVELSRGFGAQECYGTMGDRGGGEVRLSRDCSFDVSAGQPGRYQLALGRDSGELASAEFEVVSVPVAIGRTGLAVSRAGRANTARQRGEFVEFRVEMNVTDPVVMVQFVWARGGQIVSAGASYASGPVLDYVNPPVDIVPVAGPGAPRERGDSTPHTLLVFRDGFDLLGALELRGADNFQVPLTPVASPPQALVDAARERAHQLMDDDSRVKPQFADTVIPEPIACAVLSDRQARRAYVEMKESQNAAHWAWYDAAVAHDVALDDSVTERQRARLRQRMVAKAEERSHELREADDHQSVLTERSRRFARGCLAELEANGGTRR